MLGVVLIVLGLLDVHVQVGAVLAGAGLLGLVSVDRVWDLIDQRRRR